MPAKLKSEPAPVPADPHFSIATRPMMLLLALLWLALPADGNGALVIGCFDTNRAGIFSPSEGSGMTTFRSNIASLFPGATFQSTNLLTAGFLNSINLLVLTAVEGYTTEITPLSAAEQTALTNYVAGGGPALIFTDNSNNFEDASESLVQPFGLDSTGVIPSSADCTVTNLTHPVANGPFGVISNYTVASYPAWFDSLPANAVAIATLNLNNQVSIAAISPGKFTTGSGGVVFFSDSTINDGSFYGGLVPLVDNAIDFVLPSSLQAPPVLSIARTNGASVVVWWPTNFVGFRLLAATNLPAAAWQSIPLTGINQCVLPETNAATFFSLTRP